jgi:hypothetical protein
VRIHTGFEIAYDCPLPVPMMLTVSVHPSRRGDLETPEWVRTDPVVDVRQYLDGFGNICSRVLAPQGRFVISSDFVVRDSGLVDEYAPDAIQIAAHNLPDDVLVYLRPHAAGVVARAGHLRLRPRPHPFRLQSGPPHQGRL